MEKDVANIELPKDVEGREIPLDTTKLFGASGNAYNITRWIYTTDFDTSDSAAGQWWAATDTFRRLDPRAHVPHPARQLGTAGKRLDCVR